MEETTARELLEAERQATLARIQAMTGDFDEIVAASADSNLDDEHDPEGSTVAYERAQVGALLASAREHLDDVDRALTRLEAGLYGTCERCGATIAPQRLSARPVARTCLRCASGPRRH
jgi:RNA polymerase-binding transcription factor DksA